MNRESGEGLTAITTSLNLASMGREQCWIYAVVRYKFTYTYEQRWLPHIELDIAIKICSRGSQSSASLSMHGLAYISTRSFDKRAVEVKFCSFRMGSKFPAPIMFLPQHVLGGPARRDCHPPTEPLFKYDQHQALTLSSTLPL